MLFLHFHIGEDGFALSTDRIVEIVPLANLKKARLAPDAAPYCCEYRDRYIPVVDLCALELGRPARQWLSTRIVVIRHPASETMLIGLIAEHATEMLRLDPAEFAPFAAGPQGLIQHVELEDLLPGSLLAHLTDEPMGAA